MHEPCRLGKTEHCRRKGSFPGGLGIQQRVARVISGAALLVLVCSPLFPQEAAQASESPGAADVPSGFADIRLGLDRELVQSRLQGSSYFLYRGDPDVSMLPSTNRSVIETEGRTFVDRAFFQFSDNALYIIILQLSRARMDHYTVYQTLSERYGEADFVGPREISWEWEDVRLSLERPLTVKYLDRPVFEALREEAQVQRSIREVTRDSFLGDL